MGWCWLLLSLSATAPSGSEPVSSEPVSIVSNPVRQVRLHLDTEDHTLRIIDTRTEEILCYGLCDALVPADRPLRILDPATRDTEEITLSAIRHVAIAGQRRSPGLIATGGAVLGLGAAGFVGGFYALLFGWYASGNGLNPQRWPDDLMRGAGITMLVGIPLALIGAGLLIFGLRQRYETWEPL